MQATYYYPTKIPITAEAEDQDFEESKDNKWYMKARRLRNRRWKRLHRIEQSAKEIKQKRLQKIRQKHWLQRHGWPRIAQPMT